LWLHLLLNLLVTHKSRSIHCTKSTSHLYSCTQSFCAFQLGCCRRGNRVLKLQLQWLLHTLLHR
jgi:hypothetical protein